MRFLSGDTACKLSPPLSAAVLQPAHLGSYVWGDDVAKAKTQCESLDYLFQLAVEMHKLAIPWVK